MIRCCKYIKKIIFLSSFIALPALASDELDTFLGESYEGGSARFEKAMIQKLTDISIEALKRKHPENSSSTEPVPRDVHGKSHGCVFGSFRVHNDALPESLRVGLFEDNREYKTILRYSSNNRDPHYEDARGDIRGLGLKVLNAKGMSGESQDFLFLGVSTFHSSARLPCVWAIAR